MYLIPPLTPKLQAKITKYHLQKKYAKAVDLLVGNLNHPGLHVEILEPKSMGYHSFRIDRKYRGLFIIHPGSQTLQIVGITVHYH